MSIRKFVHQTKQINEYYLLPTDKVEQVKSYLRELTVSPDYQSRGVFNPFYVLDIPEDDIRPSVGDGEIKYKNVDSGSGEPVSYTHLTLPTRCLV